MATYLTGGVSSTGSSGSSGGGLAGLITGAGQLAGLTLQGLANYYTPQATAPVYTGSAQTNALPNSGASVIYNTPTQNNYSSRLNNINVSQPQDPFATQGLTSVPNMLHGNADFMTMDNATRSNSPMQSIDNLTGSATDQADPQGVGQIAPGIAPTSTNTNPGGIPAGFSQGPSPSAAAALSPSDYEQRLAEKDRTIEALTRAKEAALDRARQNYDAPNNVQPGYVAPQVPPPSALAPPPASVGAPPAQGFAGKLWGGARQFARNYQFSKHPQYAQMEMQNRQIQNAREMAWWTAKAQAEKESRDKQHDFAMLHAKQEGEHNNKVSEIQLQGEIDMKKARVAQELTDAQRLSAYGQFYHSTPNSPERQQLALRLPELANHLGDPQDQKAAAELHTAGAHATKAIVDSIVAESTMNDTVKLVLQKVRQGELSLAEAERTLSGKVDLVNSNAAISASKSRVAQATEGAQISKAQQEAWRLGVNNAYLPRTIESKMRADAAATAANVGNAMLAIPAPGRDDPAGQAMHKAIGQGVQGLVQQAVGMGGGPVPAPPSGPSAMPQYAGVPAPMGAPTGLPYGYQQASFDPRFPQQQLQSQVPQMDRTGQPLQGSISQQSPLPPQPPVYQAQPIPIPAFPNIPNNQPMPAPPVPQPMPPRPQPMQPPQPQQFGAFPPAQPVSFNQAAQNIIDQLPPALRPLGVALAGTMAGIGDGLTNGPLAQQAQREQQAKDELNRRLPQVQPEVIQSRNTLPQLPPQQDFPSGPFGQAPQSLPAQQDLPGGPFNPSGDAAAKPKSPYKIGVSNGYADVKNFRGLEVPGNIPLNERRILDMPDGSFGTELSLSFNDGKHEVLIPTIYDGAQHSIPQAIQRYRQTGMHMGKFRSGDISSIQRYAEALHNRRIEVDGVPYEGRGLKGVLHQQAPDGTIDEFRSALGAELNGSKSGGSTPMMGADGVFRGGLGQTTTDGNFKMQRYVDELGRALYGFMINGSPVRNDNGSLDAIPAADYEGHMISQRSQQARDFVRRSQPQPRRR